MKLNIGCGGDYKEGWINLDYQFPLKHDIDFDLNRIYNGEKLPFKDKTFDTIILYDVLEHFPYPLPILREMYRLCKVGGNIEIKVPEGSWVWDNLDHKREFSKNSLNTTNFDFYCSSNEVKVIPTIKKYVLPSKNIFFFLLRWLFNKTNLHVIYRRVK